MSVTLVDSSVWSRFYRNDVPDSDAYVTAFMRELASRDVVTTGVVYLELLRGFTRPSTREQIHREFEAVSFLEPTRSDYADAADLCTSCRRAGVQLGSIDALLAQLCIGNDLQLLTADRDFLHAAECIPLDVWSPA